MTPYDGILKLFNKKGLNMLDVDKDCFVSPKEFFKGIKDMIYQDIPDKRINNELYIPTWYCTRRED